MSDTSLVFNVTGRDRGVNALLAKTAANVRASNVAGAASTVALGAAMASAGAHAVALGSSVMGAVGAIGLLPGMVAATAATVVGAKAVTMGLGEAWKATGVAAAGGGGRAINTAKAVAAAQREVRAATQALADAQRDALTAQQAVTRARADETERLEDLARSVEEARLDEEEAVAAVTQAERDLADARATGNPDNIAAADRAYRRAQQTLDGIRDRVEDLSAEQADGARKGVEGSDAVQAALRRQEDAQRQVEQAAQRLADAQDAVREASVSAATGGIDPAAQALAKLSPNGRAVILTLRALAPAWQAAARAGQQATFRGVAGDLRGLSSTYLPMATRWLVRMGGSFNLAIRQSAGLAQTKQFVDDVGLVTGNTSTAVDRLARAVRPVINGLMQFAAVGSGFLPGMAGEVLSIAQRFERWAIAARESGRMQQWMATGIAVLKDLGAIAGNVVGSIRAVFAAGDDGGATLDALVRGTAAMRAWLESAEGQERVGQVLSTLRDILGGLASGFTSTDAPAGAFWDTLSVGGTVVSFLADNTDLLAKALPYLAAGFLLSRAAQTGANIAAIVSLPLKAAEVAATWGMRSAIRAQTAALIQNTAVARGAAAASRANTAATVAGDAATKRSVAGMIAQRVALMASRAATALATVAQWAYNIAQMASPTTWIILAIVALIGVIILIAAKTDWFQKAWNWAWGGVKAAAAAVGDWFMNTLWRRLILGTYNNIVNGGTRFLGWYLGLPGRLAKGLARVGSIILSPFKWGFNQIARFWNNTVGRLSFTAPSWIPMFGGMGWSMPKLPMLAKGGTFTADGGAAIVGEDGPEVITGVRGASVVPLPKSGGDSGAGGGRRGRSRLVIVAGDREAVAELRRLQEQYGF
ncbi:hypothetical protein [Micromonospora thermarum]|uniref:Phage-related protein n=1 Tax=Micromonospora thermarum TaxID=2720024 RepID=A0ABX0ZCT4_9ACTN|nr:hypothetical protein [Micromonospora thermarum]NJP33680.1 hypothetical protein [Micromonospora thermarum]